MASLSFNQYVQVTFWLCDVILWICFPIPCYDSLQRARGWCLNRMSATGHLGINIFEISTLLLIFFFLDYGTIFNSLFCWIPCFIIFFVAFSTSRAEFLVLLNSLFCWFLFCWFLCSVVFFVLLNSLFCWILYFIKIFVLFNSFLCWKFCFKNPSIIFGTFFLQILCFFLGCYFILKIRILEYLDPVPMLAILLQWGGIPFPPLVLLCGFSEVVFCTWTIYTLYSITKNGLMIQAQVCK